MDYNDVSQWAADLGSGYSRIYPLGEGGMGTLYCAHKDSLDVDVAVSYTHLTLPTNSRV